MSIQTMSAVWNHSRSEGRARLVLLAIADHQGEIGAWPSIATLAKMVNASERSVQRDIQELQALGELKVEVQSAPTRGQYKSNLYWVTLPGVTDSNLPSSGVTENESGVTNTKPGVTAGGVLTLIEPLRETNKINPQIADMFSEFWKEYPLRKDKGHALRAFKSALKRAKFEDIVAGAIAYRSDPTRKPEFTKYPATWLNADAWENAAVLPEVKAANEERRRKEIEASKRFLEEQRALEAGMRGPALCKHGLNLARCVPCSKELS